MKDRKIAHFDTDMRTRKRRRNTTVQGKADWEKHGKWRMRNAQTVERIENETPR